MHYNPGSDKGSQTTVCNTVVCNWGDFFMGVEFPWICFGDLNQIWTQKAAAWIGFYPLGSDNKLKFSYICSYSNKKVFLFLCRVISNSIQLLVQDLDAACDPALIAMSKVESWLLKGDTAIVTLWATVYGI